MTAKCLGTRLRTGSGKFCKFGKCARKVERKILLIEKFWTTWTYRKRQIIRHRMWHNKRETKNVCCFFFLFFSFNQQEMISLSFSCFWQKISPLVARKSIFMLFKDRHEYERWSRVTRRPLPAVRRHHSRREFQLRNGLPSWDGVGNSNSRIRASCEAQIGFLRCLWRSRTRFAPKQIKICKLKM